MKKICLAFIACAQLGSVANAQITGPVKEVISKGADPSILYNLCLKPNAADGQDATIMTTYGCILEQVVSPTGGVSTPTDITENLNGGANLKLQYYDWSYNGIGCGHGTTRSLIKFTGLNALMYTGVQVQEAVLKLHGVPTSLSYGNSSYPGSPYGTTNEGMVQRVTSPWQENLVTWNTKPTTTVDHQMPIPESQSRWNWDVNVNVSKMVRDIIASGCNEGFSIQLQNEAIYRGVIFASSDHADPLLWPELCITYVLPSGSKGNPIYGLCDIPLTSTGKFRQAGTIQLQQDMKEEALANALQIAPNPSAGNWNIQLTATAREQVEVMLHSLDGKLISRQTRQVDKGINSFTQSGRDLAPGTYILTIKGGTISEHMQVIRQ